MKLNLVINGRDSLVSSFVLLDESIYQNYRKMTGQIKFAQSNIVNIIDKDCRYLKGGLI
jgi:hypothetical protein